MTLRIDEADPPRGAILYWHEELPFDGYLGLLSALSDLLVASRGPDPAAEAR